LRHDLCTLYQIIFVVTLFDRLGTLTDLEEIAAKSVPFVAFAILLIAFAILLIAFTLDATAL